MKAEVYSGIDNIGSVRDELKGVRLGLITGPSGVDKKLRSTYTIIKDEFCLSALYSPDDELHTDDSVSLYDNLFVDQETNEIVYPIAGKEFEHMHSLFKNVDAVLFDIQDIGARLYIYLYTIIYAMIVCADIHKPFYVFDRMNPLSLNRCEGNILDVNLNGIGGKYPIPMRYGMTIGEFAGYINVSCSIGCNLTVVPCEGITRDMYFQDTDLAYVSPLSDIPTPDIALNYIGTCLFKGTNVSEGCGTTNPFGLIGAPWLKSSDLCRRMNEYGFDGVIIRRAFFTPMFSKYANEKCEGVQLHITDRNKYQPFEVALRLMDEIRSEFDKFEFNSAIDTIFGNDKLRKEYIGRNKIDKFLAENNDKLIQYKNRSREFYLY